MCLLSWLHVAPAGSPARRLIGADNDSGFGDHHDPVIGECDLNSDLATLTLLLTACRYMAVHVTSHFLTPSIMTFSFTIKL